MSFQQFENFSKSNELVIILLSFTIIWNICEGIISIDYGIQCKSIGLFFLGINFSICVIPPSLALQEFIKKINCNEEKTNSDIQDMMQKNKRKIGVMMTILFILLAMITFTCAIIALVLKQNPITSLPGLIITSVSLVITMLLWLSKYNLAKKINCSIASSEARYSLICLEITAIVFLNSLLCLILPSIWWLDSAATLIQGILLFIEGFVIIYARCKSNGNKYKITITIEETVSSAKEQKLSFRKSFSSFRSFGSGKRQSSKLSAQSSKLSGKINGGQIKESEVLDFLDITIDEKSLDIEILK
ncbi:6489_t:CDS:1 [Gigaspora margarita]|uniref:6489_t:CDS:1 n=1 Tax=Gigaspora margarita TaxID=4874 RepID=A0ABN7VGZ2_GIGMA|nr:6489_t:CDS:1 [Gigaspora margarita]